MSSVIISLLLNGIMVLGAQASTCGEEYFLPRVAKHSERLTRFLWNGGIEHFTQRSPGGAFWADFEDQIVQCATESHCLIRLENDQFRIHAEVTRGLGQMTLSFDHFALKRVQMGGRSSGLQTGLARLTAHTLEGTRRAVEKDPEIQTVRLEARMVLNPSLARMLESWGFEGRVSRYPFRTYRMILDLR